MKIMNAIQKFGKKANKKATALTVMAMVAMTTAVGSVGAAPTTGNTDVDAILTSMEGGFDTAKQAFIYLALAAIPVTLIVVLFFWLRGKFKQSVSGA